MLARSVDRNDGRGAYVECNLAVALWHCSARKVHKARWIIRSNNG